MQLAIASCGFEPLHSREYQASLAVGLSEVSINASGRSVASSTLNISATNTVSFRYAELLEAEIMDQVNPRGERGVKKFRVDISFDEFDTPLFVNPDGTASRGDLAYSSTYTIIRLADNAPVASGSLQRVSSYNTSPSADYASYVSIEDARKRGITELAQDYKLRLASLLPTLGDAKALPAQDPAAVEALPKLQPVKGYETYRTGY
jgi:hypothetical protein